MIILKSVWELLGICEGFNAQRIGPILRCGDVDKPSSFIMSGKVKNTWIPWEGLGDLVDSTGYIYWIRCMNIM